MGLVAHEFDCLNVIHGEDNSWVTFVDFTKCESSMFYDFYCKSTLDHVDIKLFFNFRDTGSMTFDKCLIVAKQGGIFSCSRVGFWVCSNDLPFMTTKTIYGLEMIIESIADEFKSKYASYLIDKRIND